MKKTILLITTLLLIILVYPFMAESASWLSPFLMVINVVSPVQEEEIMEEEKEYIYSLEDEVVYLTFTLMNDTTVSYAIVDEMRIKDDMISFYTEDGEYCEISRSFIKDCYPS